MQPNRLLLVAVIAVGLAVGVWHLYLASLAIFLFRAEEHWTSWAAVLLGPGATFIAVAACIFSRRNGGIALLTLAGLALAAFAIGPLADSESLAAFFTKITLPMAALGTLVLVLSRRPRVPEATC